jgi:hypothetical protein
MQPRRPVTALCVTCAGPADGPAVSPVGGGGFGASPLARVDRLRLGRRLRRRPRLQRPGRTAEPASGPCAFATVGVHSDGDVVWPVFSFQYWIVFAPFHPSCELVRGVHHTSTHLARLSALDHVPDHCTRTGEAHTTSTPRTLYLWSHSYMYQAIGYIEQYGQTR